MSFGKLGAMGRGMGHLGSLGTPGLPLYTGMVATRARAPVGFGATFREANFRSGHYARDNISQVKIGIPNFYCNSGGTETGPGGSVTYYASLEYPAGNFTQFLFSGATSVSAANLSVVESDTLTLATPVPNGALFWIRFYVQSATGIMFQSYGNGTVLGDQNELTTTTTTNKTMGGSLTNGANCFRPLYIVGPTRKRSIALFGDSLTAGTNESTSSSETTPDLGILARWIGPNFAYSQLGLGAETAASFPTKGALRRAVLPYCSDAIFGHGLNDIFVSSASLATLESAWATNWAYATDLGKRAWQPTITPRPTSSSDNWATPGNQVVDATKNGVRISANAKLRSNAYAGISGYFEVSDVLENSRDDGKFITNGTANFYTTDGTHGTGNAYALLPAALSAAAIAAFGH